MSAEDADPEQASREKVQRAFQEAAMAMWPTARVVIDRAQKRWWSLCGYGRDTISDQVTATVLRIAQGELTVSTRLDPYLSTVANHQAMGHARGCPACKGLVDPVSGSHGGDDGSAPSGEDPPVGPEDAPEDLVVAAADMTRIRVAIHSEREARPECPWHRPPGKVCFHTVYFSTALNGLWPRDDVLEGLRERLETDLGYKKETAQTYANRHVACYDWWVYIGSSAIDPARPASDYEDQDSLAGRWPVKAKDLPPDVQSAQRVLENATVQAIGTARFLLLDHLTSRVDKTSGEEKWVGENYSREGASAMYNERDDLKRVVDHQRPNIRAHIDRRPPRDKGTEATP